MVESVLTAQSKKLIQLRARAVEPDILAKSSPAPRALWQRRYGTALAITDFAVVSAAVALAQLLRFGTKPATLAGLSSLGYSIVSVLLVGGWGFFLAIFRTRSPSIVGAGSEEFRRVWTATLSLFGGIAIVSTLFKVDLARGYLVRVGNHNCRSSISTLCERRASHPHTRS